MIHNILTMCRLNDQKKELMRCYSIQFFEIYFITLILIKYSCELL